MGDPPIKAQQNMQVNEVKVENRKCIAGLCSVCDQDVAAVSNFSADRLIQFVLSLTTYRHQ